MPMKHKMPKGSNSGFYHYGWLKLFPIFLTSRKWQTNSPNISGEFVVVNYLSLYNNLPVNNKSVGINADNINSIRKVRDIKTYITQFF